MIEAFFNKVIPAESISANRLGQWSDAQREQVLVNTTARIWVIGSAILAALMVLFSVVLKTLGASPSNLLMMAALLGAALLFAVMRILGLTLLRRRMLGDSFSSCDGRIVYQQIIGLNEGGAGKAYYPVGENGKIIKHSPLFGMRWKLPPGRYRFYHLSKAAMLFSAEPLSGYGEYELSLLETIAECFHFTLTELENYRSLAQAGRILVTEGEYKEIYLTVDSDSHDHELFEIQIGAVTFDCHAQDTGCILRELKYRAYYQVEESGGILKNVLKSQTKLLALEPVGLL